MNMGRYRPRHTAAEEKLVVAMSVNALVQLLLDVIFEAMHIIPTRVNHLSLTFLNAFISYKTLSAIRKNRFSFMHEDCQILWLMEVCLILGDVYYAIYDEFSLKFLFVRLFFIVCSLFNWVAVSVIMCKYQLWSLSYKGHGDPSRQETWGETIRRSIRELSASPPPEPATPRSTTPRCTTPRSIFSNKSTEGKRGYDEDMGDMVIGDDADMDSEYPDDDIQLESDGDGSSIDTRPRDTNILQGIEEGKELTRFYPRVAHLDTGVIQVHRDDSVIEVGSVSGSSTALLTSSSTGK